MLVFALLALLLLLSLASGLTPTTIAAAALSTNPVLPQSSVLPQPSVVSVPRQFIDDAITRQICRHLESIIYDSKFTSPVPDISSRVSTSDYLVWLTLLLRPKIREKSSSYASILLPQFPKLPFQFSNLLFQWIFTFAFKNGFVSGGIVGYSDAADLDNFEYIVSPANKVKGVRIRDCHFLKQAQCYSLCERGCAEVAEFLYNEVGGADPDQLLSVEPEWQSIGGRGCQWKFGSRKSKPSSYMC